MRTRVAGVIIDRERIVLIHRKKEGREYWVFPGGGVEKGESLSGALKREVEEETGLLVKPVKLLYKYFRKDTGNFEFFYLCKVIKNNPLIFTGPEKARNKDQLYAPEWVPLTNIPETNILPPKIKILLLKDLKTDFSGSWKEAWEG